MSLVAEVKAESSNQLRCAHGMCGAPQPLTAKLIWKTLIQKDVDELSSVSTNEWVWVPRWRILFRTNPQRWVPKIREWTIIDSAADILALEIQKEIDAEIIAELSALAHE